MLRRLFLTILMACLAAPAVAMPGHCEMTGTQGQSTATISDHGAHHAPPTTKDGAMDSAARDCIGCIAPYHDLPEPNPGESMTGLDGTSPLAVLNTGPALQPDPPPPRA